MQLGKPLESEIHSNLYPLYTSHGRVGYKRRWNSKDVNIFFSLEMAWCERVGMTDVEFKRIMKKINKRKRKENAIRKQNKD